MAYPNSWEADAGYQLGTHLRPWVIPLHMGLSSWASLQLLGLPHNMVVGFQEQQCQENAFYDIALEVIVLGSPRSDSKEGKGHRSPTSQWDSCQHHIVSKACEIGDIVEVIWENTICYPRYYKGEIQLNQILKVKFV